MYFLTADTKTRRCVVDWYLWPGSSDHTLLHKWVVCIVAALSHDRDLECGGNAAALALFATDSSRGTFPLSYRSAESQSAAAGGALQMAFNMMHHPLIYKGVV